MCGRVIFKGVGSLRAGSLAGLLVGVAPILWVGGLVYIWVGVGVG